MVVEAKMQISCAKLQTHDVISNDELDSQKNCRAVKIYTRSGNGSGNFAIVFFVRYSSVESSYKSRRRLD